MAGSTRAVGSTDLQQKGYHMIFGGRLTLTSGIPVTEADVVGASTVYFTPLARELTSRRFSTARNSRKGGSRKQRST